MQISHCVSHRLNCSSKYLSRMHIVRHTCETEHLSRFREKQALALQNSRQRPEKIQSNWRIISHFTARVKIEVAEKTTRKNERVQASRIHLCKSEHLDFDRLRQSRWKLYKGKHHLTISARLNTYFPWAMVMLTFQWLGKVKTVHSVLLYFFLSMYKPSLFNERI